jgi:hypothetical protein
MLNLAAVAVLGAGLASAQAGNGYVRVVHASPDAPAVDIYVESNIVLEALPFREYSDYLAVPAGTYTVSIKVSGTDTTVKSFPVTLAAGKYYSAIAVGYATGGKQPGFDVLALEDDLALPANNGVKLRVIHGAPGAPAVDVYVTTPFETLMGKTAALTKVPFKAYSPYVTVPVGTYQARVAVADTKTVAIDSGRLITWNNMIRTVIAVDTKGGGAPFDIIILPDRN